VQSTLHTGIPGDAGGELITTFADAGEMHPAELVTVKVYVPGARPKMVVEVVVPVEVTFPGFRVKIQLPEGKPLNATLPVAMEQVGCVGTPATGAAGVGDIVTRTLEIERPHPPDAGKV
jgi:hypothetical protein